MKRTTLADFRARGGSYPRPVTRSAGDFAGEAGTPLPDDHALTSLLRMPSPAALRRLLREDAPISLHGEGVHRAYAGDPARVWSWPGVREFGAIALLDPWPLSPTRAPAHDAYLIEIDPQTPVPPASAIYVPDEECCRAVEEAASFDEARPLLPRDYGARLDQAIARIDRYFKRWAAAQAVHEASDETLTEFGLARADLERPLYTAPQPIADRIDALARRLSSPF